MALPPAPPRVPDDPRDLNRACALLRFWADGIQLKLKRRRELAVLLGGVPMSAEHARAWLDALDAPAPLDVALSGG